MSSTDSSEASKSATFLQMRRLKLEAIEKGQGTDCSFLVGQDKNTASLVHCFKGDLLLATEYFQGMMRSSLTGPCPVHIKHIQPHIFKMVIRFISVHHLDEISNVEDAVLLALAAEEFLLEPLKTFSCLEIERMVTVENVWRTLNSTCLIPKLAATCSKVLSSETTKCLEDSAFLEASKDSLIFLLQMDSLNIKSELDLVNATLKLAKSWSEKEGFELMRAALPHLRLLTLPLDKHTLLTKFLLPEEKTYLLRQVYLKEEKSSDAAPPSLNTNENPRMRAKSCNPNTLELISESSIITDNFKMIDQVLNNYYCYKKIKHRCTINVRPSFCLKGIEILTRGNNFPNLIEIGEKYPKRIEPDNTEYDEDLRLSVTGSFKFETKSLFSTRIQGKKKYNSWFYFAFDKDIFIQNGVRCCIEVSPNCEATYQFVKIIANAECSVSKICNCHDQSWNFDRQNYIFKSVTLVPY